MAEIVDCIIDGGTSLDVPCPGDINTCVNDPSGEATIWNPRARIALSPDTKTVSERLIAVEGQVLFELHLFDYATSTNSLEIHKNGLLLSKDLDWVEQSPTTFQLAIGATAGDELVATGWVGIIGNVDVRDTDIYVSNYQAVRDYTLGIGTETLLYAKGKVLAADGGEDFFIYLIGAAIGFYVDNNSTILVPTGGDGTAAWVRRGDLIFPTLNDLVVSPSVTIGDVVTTFGYYTAGDGGANRYQIVIGGSGIADGGLYIDLSGTGFQALALFAAAPTEYNVIQWGAKGDNSTDDSVPVQRAIDQLFILGGGTLEFPITAAGSIYLCNFTLQDNTSIRGKSRDVTLKPVTNAPVITVDRASPINRLTIQLLVIDGIDSKAIFTSQDGILIQPNGGIIQDKINIIECIITDCGNRGVVFDASAPLSEMREATIHRSTLRAAANSGLYLTGDVSSCKITSSVMIDSGDENTELDSNIVLTSGGGTFPVDVSFDSCRIENANYLVSGVCMLVTGVLGLSIRNCSFVDFFTGIRIKTGPNGQVIVSDSRFERSDVTAIESLVDLVNANGFTFSNNNCAAALVGTVGVKYSSSATAVVKVDIDSNNSWGGLTKSVDNTPAATVTAGDVNLPHRFGMLPITLANAGTADLNNIYDEKGGTAQLVAGDEVVLHTVDPTKNVVVKDGIGNIQLAGGVDFTLSSTVKLIKLVWSSYSSAWLEMSRSDN